MNTLKSKIKNNWISFIIILQPILDILSYFQTKFLGSSYSWIIRIAILILVFIVTYINSTHKKKLFLYLLPYGIFFVLHIFNLYINNLLNIVLDIKYFILVFQLPILTLLLIDYIKQNNYNLNKIRISLLYCFYIIIGSMILALITNTSESTYYSGGILGWFSSANTQSMILCALAPWVLYMLSDKNIFSYLIGYIIVFVVLYLNATRSCYLALVSSLFVIIFALCFSKQTPKKWFKIAIASLFLLLAIGGYKFSFTFEKEILSQDVTDDYVQNIQTIINDDVLQTIDFNNINLSDNAEVSRILKTSYLYTRLMDIHGEDAVVEIMKPYLSAQALSNNRLSKVINAKISFKNSNSLPKILGIGYSQIAQNGLDLENDLQSIFYYYGSLGFMLYITFIVYFVIRLVILFFKNPSIIHDKEYIILSFLLLLLVVGGEYSGAFLRKSNANIYLSLYLTLIYFKLTNAITEEKLNKKKITFLLLHLGYGGIESATINTANALSDKYEIELISFYNLLNNQTKYINKNIKVKYLYNGEPNRTDFINALKNKNIIQILKEGFKSLDILTKKKYLIKKEIKKSDSFAIISTRYDFSSLLSKYGNENTIKITQEHHHHNNNKKYINILKNKYNNLDYLFALTEELKKDYSQFLHKNKKTKIVVVPNMFIPNVPSNFTTNGNNIISISRLHEGKKLDELIDIFSKIKNKNTKLYIIGDGDEKNKLEQKIQNLKLSDRIIMTGYLDKNQQLEYLSKSSIYAMTSISEGLPMILLEAMSCGIPCIAYETDSGIHDIIDNNKNGFIVKNRNQKEYINKLDLLLEDFTLRNSMSTECKSTCVKYYKENILKIWENILNN